MGKIKCFGKASRRVEYDRMALEFTFSKDGLTPGQASRMALEESENFLRIVRKIGLDYRDFSMEENSIAKKYDRDGYTATRILNYQTGYSIPLINDMMTIIDDYELDMGFSHKDFISEREQILKELLKEALEDSKRQAQDLASLVDQNITGIVEINYGDYMAPRMLKSNYSDSSYNRDKMLSDDLSAGSEKLEQNLEVIWECN